MPHGAGYLECDQCVDEYGTQPSQEFIICYL